VHMQPLPARHQEISRRFGFDFVTCGFGQTESGLSCYAIIEETDATCETPTGFQFGRPREEIRALAAQRNVLWLTPDQAHTAGAGFMGKPSLFVEAAVLDEHDQHCPPGTPGQLCFRPRLPGLLLKEYLGKPEATLKAFSNLWFHTGDSARRTETGEFYFMDRLGDRIRVRGENTSTFHVEDLINQCPGVAMSAAFGVPAQEGYEDDIAVFIVLHPEHDFNETFVSEWAEKHMPKFMRPRHIRIVSEIPRTLTQKVEKFKLKQKLLEELGLDKR
jgi:crotonobetaine/carnitine-CoA ligase